jgi:ABC-type Fe3+-hydroxamate transport system substrate-binding protein
MRVLHDDLGMPVLLPRGGARRVVALVPSLTEAIAVTAPGVLVGATDWCTHPADLDVTRVRGTKNPNLGVIADLAPDLVVANKEENRELDVRRLRESGIPVWVTDIETVPQAITSMRRLLTAALGRDEPPWLTEAGELWDGPLEARRRGSSHHRQGDGAGPTIAVAIWRDPWMVVGPRTYTTDLLARLGYVNAFMAGEERYPHVDLSDIDRDGIDEVWLPDEPYVFTAEDGPEAFDRVPTRLVPGRLLTWYGPAMIEARRALSA